MGTVRKLTEDDIQARLAQFARTRDPRILDELVLQYANLVESIGRRFVGACEPLEDLTQEGYIGLIASLDKYDADKGVKFSTYATHFIIGQIKHYLRDKGKIIKEPAWLQELNQKMTRVIESLHQQNGRQPTEREIADVMQMPERTVRDLLTTREVFKVSSLDGGDKEEASGTHDTEKIADDRLLSFQLPLEDKIVLENALERLKDIEQQVIADHFYQGLNQTEIARKLGISCNYVSHILRNGTKKLRKILATEEIRDTQMQRALLSRRVQPGSAEEPTDVIDSITGVYSRQYITRRLDEELSRAYRYGDGLAVMLLEVRLPDSIEDYVRMLRMDDLLYTVARGIREGVRKMDVVGRYSDTCFILVLPHSPQCEPLARRLQELVESIAIDAGRNSVKATARIGFAAYPDEAANAGELLSAAADRLGVRLKELKMSDRSELRRAA